MAYFKYLQLILLEYDPIRIVKSIMLWYLSKNVKPCILTELQNKDLELENFVWIIKKTLIAKAKINLWPWATTCNINQYCSQGFSPNYTIAAKANTT